MNAAKHEMFGRLELDRDESVANSAAASQDPGMLMSPHSWPFKNQHWDRPTVHCLML